MAREKGKKYKDSSRDRKVGEFFDHSWSERAAEQRHHEDNVMFVDRHEPGIGAVRLG